MAESAWYKSVSKEAWLRILLLILIRCLAINIFCLLVFLLNASHFLVFTLARAELLLILNLYWVYCFLLRIIGCVELNIASSRVLKRSHWQLLRFCETATSHLAHGWSFYKSRWSVEEGVLIFIIKPSMIVSCLLNICTSKHILIWHVVFRVVEHW